MPNSFRDIRRRIKGVKSTRQLTKTMEMVSASKMRRAQGAALQIRAYAEKALEILGEVSSAEKGKGFSHPLLESREPKRITVVLITSDRGLCGGLNANIIAKVLEEIKGMSPETVSFVTLGKKGREAMARMGFGLEADFSGLKRFEPEDVTPLIHLVMKEYQEGKTDRVIVAYSRFVNTLVQRPAFRPLLPLTHESVSQILEEAVGKGGAAKPKRTEQEFKFEPSPAAVLANLLPKCVEIQLYKAVLEAQASEHSARMAAMRNATDAAEEIIEDLTFSSNQARQASITAEIAEIATAAEALK